MSWPVRGGAGPQAAITGTFQFGATLTAAPLTNWSFTAGQWYRDGVPIGGATALTYQQVQADVGHTLAFVPTNPVYTSPASAGGQNPTVATVPGAPVIGVATAGDGLMNVLFSAPASNGGSNIIGYRVTLSDGTIATGAASPITVAGLTDGTPYTAVVQALNAIGYSAPSAASNAVTPTLPPLYMIASNNFALPTDWGTGDTAKISDGQDGRTGGTGTSLYKYFKRRKKFTTGAWAPQGGKFLFANASNGVNAILDSLFSITVQRCEIRLLSDLSLVDTVKFATATSKVLATGERMWTDAIVNLAANTTYCLDYYYTVPDHASFPTGHPLYMTGEVAGESLGTNLSLGSMGTGIGFSIGGYFEPAAFVATGWDASPTPFLMGDSIMDGTNVCAPFATARGDLGHVQGACGDATAGRWNYCSSARYSASFLATYTDNMGGFGGKNIIDWFADACALLQTAPIFSFVWSEHARNTLSSLTALVTQQSYFNAFMDKLHSRYPTMKVVQQTVTSSGTLTANNWGTSEAGMLTTGSNSDAGGNGIIRQWNNWVIAGCGGRAMGIDTASVVRGTAYDKWYVPPFSALLISAVTANNTNLVTLSARPDDGMALVFEAGDATNADGMNGASPYGVASSVANGINWDCTLNSKRWGQQNPASPSVAVRVLKAHAIGAAVAASGSTDNLHPTPYGTQAMMAYNIAQKAAIAAYVA